MGRKKMLPIGYDSFDTIRNDDFYYIDKTGLIRELLENKTQVTLFTRPRRFGKSLNISMLSHFFSVEGDKSIFDGLEISKETELCERYMGRYPVIFITLKSIEASDYETAYQQAAWLIRNAALKAEYLADSDILSAEDKSDYQALLNLNMTEVTLCNSLNTLSRLLKKHHGKKAVLLIDEYDVPLAGAHAGNYYDRMVSLIRSLLGTALKTNESLELAVLTGCLRISKESIFTGLNNLKVRSISGVRFAEYFGFTDEEASSLLSYYGHPDKYPEAKKWYDGYRFGGTEVYCPWDVLNYCDALLDSPDAQPQDYWINTSGNDVIKRFVAMADNETRGEIETLVAGGTIEKDIREDLTYSEIYDSIDNLWSLLYTTGYLTMQGMNRGALELRIPNLEVRDVFVKQIREYFKESVKKDTGTLERLCAALLRGDPEDSTKCINKYLRRTISVRDAMAKEGQKENFYQGVLVGILSANEGWSVKSNRESGDGYADIIAKPDDGELGIAIVIEIKYGSNLDGACRDALDQIERRRYAEELREEGMDSVLKYGIGCYKKTCRVALGR